MRKIFAVMALLILLCTPVQADYLQAADEAAANAARSGDGQSAEAADELKEYVYQSGAARDVKAEQRRLAIYNYMLNMKKQQWDYSQRIRTETYELSGKNPELDYHTELAHYYAKVSALFQDEISRNEAYLKKITDNISATDRADELMDSLPKEKNLATRYAADIVCSLAAICFIVLLLWLLRAQGKGQMSQIKRDYFRILRSGRYAISAAAIICAVIAGIGCVEYNKWDKGYTIDPPPESTGEYLTDVEALDEYVYSQIKNSDFSNTWKYEVATAYADILNNRVAKDMNALIKTYKARAAAARTEAERLGGAAWQEYNSAEIGPDAKYGERMDNYIGLSLDAGNKIFEAEYCENIIALMTNESAVPDLGAEEKVKADIDAIYRRIENIRAEFQNPGNPPYELAALIGLAAGLILAALAALLIGRIRMAARLKRQNEMQGRARHGKIMDEINFRG